MHWLNKYVAEVGEVRAAGDNTEGTYRTPIDNMLKAAADEFAANVGIRQEPGRIRDIGAPDFLISAKSGGGVVGYVECKKPGANLHKETTKAQVERYRALSENILLTDSYRWVHLRDGKIANDVQLPMTKPDKRKRDDMSALLRAFLTAEVGQIGDSKQLAVSLAYRCAILREGLLKHKGNKQSRLYKLLEEFKKALDRNLDYARFADVFAQTLVYSLLMAKLNTKDGEQLTLDTTRRRIPENFAVIRQITSFLPDIDDSVYKGIRWIVSDILGVINGMDRVAIAESMSYKKDIAPNDDPYINFYESFLAEYDPNLRKSRGVYYTPSPVVRFIVRAADDLLRGEFNMPKGLAERSKVTALDFAAGTGTFMLEMARLLFEGKSPARVGILGHEHFLPNFYGFEMMTSAYVISHLKLSRFLADNGIRLQKDGRIKVYLANTLERIDKQIELALVPDLAREVKSADRVKDSKVLVIVGNPPYSGHSQNKGAWINDLLRGIEDGENIGGSYYEIDGVKLKETNTKWLQDDYVKFIRFAQHKMDMAKRGIVAVITNHAFLDNPTFRGMRKSLMDTFDALYFLNLHGNMADKYNAADSTDENVFDIRQGVAISLLVKNAAAENKGVFYADLRGTRESKYEACEADGIDSIGWQTLKPASPNFLFVPRSGGKGYDKFYALDKIFNVYNAGCTTARDRFTLGFSEAEIRQRLAFFVNMPPEDAREYFALGDDVQDWSVERAQKDLRDSGLKDERFCPFAYRPFDTRYTYYTGKSRGFLCRPRRDVMTHMLQDNVGLLASRQHGVSSVLPVFAVSQIPDINCIADMSTTAYLFPLYTYDSEMGAEEKRENFTDEFRKWINNRYGEVHTPGDILGCIYAILHSPDYRRRYADFLRADVPRIPFPENNKEFKRLAAIGDELIKAHLLQKNCGGKLAELDGEETTRKVAKVRYDEGGERLYFNKDEYFAPIPPEVFNFQIGGYKPLEKYLKARKERKLSADDVDTIEKAANAIKFTIDKMGEIDP